MGLANMVSEIVNDDQNTNQKPNQVQPASDSDSDSSSDIEEEEKKRQDNYELPVIYNQRYLDGEQERVVAYTEIFLPDTKKLRENIRLYNERV